MEEIRITLETLYDLLRNEKKREDLQKLNSTFFLDVITYLKEKTLLLQDKQSEDDLFADGEKERINDELRSIRRILKEIYEKREKKIIDIALNKSRTRSGLIDTSSMLVEEKEFYRKLIALLDSQREGILINLLKCRAPGINSGPVKSNDPAGSASEPEEETPKPNKEIWSENNTEELKTEKKKIKVVKLIDKFVWKDLKEYGPYQEGEEIEMFSEVADLMIKKEYAVED